MTEDSKDCIPDWPKKKEDTPEAQSEELSTQHNDLLLAKADFYRAGTSLVNKLDESLPKLIAKAEKFFETKEEAIIERLKQELTRQMNFLIVKILFDAGMVDRETLDKASMMSHTVLAPQDPVQPGVGDDVLSNFTKPTGLM